MSRRSMTHLILVLYAAIISNKYAYAQTCTCPPGTTAASGTTNVSGTTDASGTTDVVTVTVVTVYGTTEAPMTTDACDCTGTTQDVTTAAQDSGTTGVTGTTGVATTADQTAVVTSDFITTGVLGTTGSATVAPTSGLASTMATGTTDVISTMTSTTTDDTSPANSGTNTEAATKAGYMSTTAESVTSTGSVGTDSADVGTTTASVTTGDTGTTSGYGVSATPPSAVTAVGKTGVGATANTRTTTGAETAATTAGAQTIQHVHVGIGSTASAGTTATANISDTETPGTTTDNGTTADAVNTAITTPNSTNVSGTGAAGTIAGTGATVDTTSIAGTGHVTPATVGTGGATSTAGTEATSDTAYTTGKQSVVTVGTGVTTSTASSTAGTEDTSDTANTTGNWSAVTTAGTGVTVNTVSNTPGTETTSKTVNTTDNGSAVTTADTAATAGTGATASTASNTASTASSTASTTSSTASTTSSTASSTASTEAASDTANITGREVTAGTGVAATTSVTRDGDTATTAGTEFTSGAEAVATTHNIATKASSGNIGTTAASATGPVTTASGASQSASIAAGAGTTGDTATTAGIGTTAAVGTTSAGVAATTAAAGTVATTAGTGAVVTTVDTATTAGTGAAVTTADTATTAGAAGTTASAGNTGTTAASATGDVTTASDATQSASTSATTGQTTDGATTAAQQQTDAPTTGAATTAAQQQTDAPTTGAATTAAQQQTDAPTTGATTTAAQQQTDAPTTGAATTAAQQQTDAPTTGAATTAAQQQTDAPTTGAVTTAAQQQTDAPTTGAATTAAQQTDAPTTGAATTAAQQQTDAPTTGAATTAAQQTDAPTTGAVTTAAQQQTDAPTTGAVTTAAQQQTDAPTTGAATTAAQQTDAPTTGTATTAAQQQTAAPTTGAPTTAAQQQTDAPTTGTATHQASTAGQTETPATTAVQQQTDAPTTGAGTTAAQQQTDAPTTGAATTAAQQQTDAPTTGAATTAAQQQTDAPTTGAATTAAPQTDAPTTGAVTTAAQQQTDSPTTGTTAAATATQQQQTDAPTTAAQQQSTDGPTTAAQQQSTGAPTTAAQQQTTDAPTTAAQQQSTDAPTTAAQQQSTDGPTTAAQQQSTDWPTTSAQRQSTDAPTTAAQQQSTNGPTTAAQQQSTDAPTTAAHQQSTDGPTTTAIVTEETTVISTAFEETTLPGAITTKATTKAATTQPVTTKTTKAATTIASATTTKGGTATTTDVATTMQTTTTTEAPTITCNTQTLDIVVTFNTDYTSQACSTACDGVINAVSTNQLTCGGTQAPNLSCICKRGSITVIASGEFSTSLSASETKVAVQSVLESSLRQAPLTNLNPDVSSVALCQGNACTNECQGENDCDDNSVCYDKPDGYGCECKDGYERQDATTCSDINECNGLNNCDDNADCTNTAGSYSCECRAGFDGNGQTCQAEVKMSARAKWLATWNANYGDTTTEDYTTLKNTIEGHVNSALVETYEISDVTDIRFSLSAGEVLAQMSLWFPPNSAPNQDDMEDAIEAEDSTFEANSVIIGDPDPCQAVSNPARGTVTQHSQGQAHATVLTYVCNEGYAPSADSQTCNSGLWVPARITCQDIDECAGSNDCDSEATCINTDGSYTCTCLAGYSGTGQSCADIDECDDNSHNCHEQATCTNNVGSFMCECNSGYQGDGVTCRKIILFTHGNGAVSLQDNYIEDTTGLRVSPLINVPTRFAYDEAYYDNIYYTQNGLIVLTNSDVQMFWRHASSYTSIGSDYKFIAPLWTDVDLSNSVDVKHEVFNKYDTSVDSATKRTAINNRIAELSAYDDFEAVWAICITWTGMAQPLDSDVTVDIKRNTFQAILATDCHRSFALFLYKEAGMLWDTSQPSSVLIGYDKDDTTVAFYTNADFETMADKIYRPDQYAGENTNFKGQSLHRLANLATTTKNHYCECRSWHESSAADVDINFDEIQIPCPTTLAQAQVDLNFDLGCVSSGIHSPRDVRTLPTEYGASSDENYICYSSSQETVTVGDTDYTVGVTCTYNNDAGGAFREGFTTPYASSFYQLYHPRGRGNKLFHDEEDSYNNWLAGDVKGRYYCCDQANLCNLYHDRRSSSITNGYQPPAISNNGGDPHITTGDATRFTFNALGDFILLQVYQAEFNTKVCEVQGRLESAPIPEGKTSYATVFTAFAHRCGINMVQYVVDVANSDLTLTIYQDGADAISVDKTAVLNGESAFSNDDRMRVYATHDGKVASECNGCAMYVDLTAVTNPVSAVFFVDVSFLVPSSGHATRGIMGVIDGDPSNDFNDRDGNSLEPQPTSTDQAIHDHIISTWKTTSAEDSIFVYTGSDSWASFDTASQGFTPKFLPQLLEEASADTMADVDATCGTGEDADKSCQFDALATENVAIGGATKQAAQAFSETSDALTNVPPAVNGGLVTVPEGYEWRDDGVFAVLVGTEYNVQLSAEDENGDDITYAVQGPNWATISDTGLLVFTPPDTNSFGMTIVLSDGKAESVFPLKFASCKCQNNGVCDFENPVVGTVLSDGLFYRASCTCTAGYDGVECANDFDSCATNPCFTGVACTDEPPPSVEPVCGSCPDGMVGDGLVCTDKDECTSTDQIDNKEYCSQECTNSQKSCTQEGGLTVCTDGYSCSCYAGNELQADGKTCTDINECQAAESPCDVNAMCTNTDGSYVCACVEGYAGDGKTPCADVNECSAASYPCLDIAVCTNTEGSYTCACPDGYIGDGKTTCEDVDECARPDLYPCRDHSTCENTLGSYSCICDVPQWKLNPDNADECINVDECTDNTHNCGDHATCTDTEGGYTCACDSGYAGNGITCADINECETGTATCPDHSTCTNTEGAYTCPCNEGYEGETCTDVDECDSDPCWENSACSNTDGSYECTCNDGYVINTAGDGCEDLDECAKDLDDCGETCTNQDPPTKFECSCTVGYVLNADGKQCDASEACDDPSICDANAKCAKYEGTNTCTCNNGYTHDGSSCADIDECASNTDSCDDTNGVCINTAGTYTCDCSTGYELATDDRTCINIDECTAGTDDCDDNALCADTVGSFTCTCNDGYSGDGTTCADDNECGSIEDNNCVSDATCTNTAGSYTCACDEGYQGDAWTECFDIDECKAEMSPCATNAVCMNTVGGYTCTCMEGYEGDTPSDSSTECTDIDECDAAESPCHQHAACTNTAGTYYCQCGAGFRGDGATCTDIDECAEDGTICDTQATCTNTAGTYTCACNAGYSGDGKTSCTDIDECSTGTDTCDTNAACTNNAGSFACQCNEGYINIDGGTAETGECQDVDECTLGTDTCGSNTDCANTAGSFTCDCKTGFERMADGINCQDIDECTTGDHECLTADHKKCRNTPGSHECECQTGYYLDNTACVDADSRQLSVEFTHIGGRSVTTDSITVSKKDELASDVQDMLDNDSDLNAKLKSVTTYSFTQNDDHAVVVFNINLDATNDITDADILTVFSNGLTGTSNTVAPDNIIRAESASVAEAEFNPCVEGTTTCDSKDNYGCLYLGDGDSECGCLEGYKDTGGTCKAINPCTESNDWKATCTPLHFTECMNNAPGQFSCEDCVDERTEVNGICESHKRYVATMRLTSFNDETSVTDSLNDRQSAEFIELEEKVCKYTKLAIQANDPDMAEKIQDCYVASLRDGSILVDTVIGFEETYDTTSSDVQTALGMGSEDVVLEAQGLTALEVDTEGFTVADPSTITCPTDHCGKHGTCTIEQRNYQPECSCEENYSGTLCDIAPRRRKLSGGEIAGIVIGCLVLIALIVIIIVVIVKVVGKGTKVHPPTPEPVNDPERQ